MVINNILQPTEDKRKSLKADKKRHVQHAAAAGSSVQVCCCYVRFTCHTPGLE